MARRRAHDVPPPPLPAGAEYSQFADARYAALPPEARPCAESVKDVAARLLPYWYHAVVPDLRTGAYVLVVSHGNTLRAGQASRPHIDEQIAELNIPTGIPLAYELGPDMHPVIQGRPLPRPGAGGRPAARRPRRRHHRPGALNARQHRCEHVTGE